MQYDEHKLRKQEIASQMKKFEKYCLNLYNVVNLEFKYMFALLSLQFIVNY